MSPVISVPFGKYSRTSPVGVLVGPALPRRMGVGEIDRDIGWRVRAACWAISIPWSQVIDLSRFAGIPAPSSMTPSQTAAESRPSGSGTGTRYLLVRSTRVPWRSCRPCRSRGHLPSGQALCGPRRRPGAGRSMSSRRSGRPWSGPGRGAGGGSGRCAARSPSAPARPWAGRTSTCKSPHATLDISVSRGRGHGRACPRSAAATRRLRRSPATRSRRTRIRSRSSGASEIMDFGALRSISVMETVESAGLE